MKIVKVDEFKLGMEADDYYIFCPSIRAIMTIEIDKELYKCWCSNEKAGRTQLYCVGLENSKGEDIDENDKISNEVELFLEEFNIQDILPGEIDITKEIKFKEE